MMEFEVNLPYLQKELRRSSSAGTGYAASGPELTV